VWAVQFQLADGIPNMRQREGRPGRDPTVPGLFLTLYESWVGDIQLADLPDDEGDPDAPLTRLDRDNKHPTKKQRISRASVAHMQSSKCRRLLYADYFQDNSEDGL
jgi:hypothetical protein